MRAPKLRHRFRFGGIRSCVRPCGRAFGRDGSGGRRANLVGPTPAFESTRVAHLAETSREEGGHPMWSVKVNRDELLKVVERSRAHHH